jgi:hypothetical protein
MLIIKFLLAIVLTEAITEIVTKSEIFQPFRKKIFDLGKNNTFFEWFHKLLDCGYCFSVWSGVLVAILLLRDLHLVNVFIDWFIVGLVLHRLANLFHNIMDRVHGL